MIPFFTYEQHARDRMAEYGISERWIEQTLRQPQKVELDKDDATVWLYFRRIFVQNNDFLVVVARPTPGQYHVITTFFDW